MSVDSRLSRRQEREGNSMSSKVYPAARRKSVPVRIGNVAVGGDAPIMVQSMTNTDTADAEATAAQVEALARAGSAVVRITVDREEAAQAVPRLRALLDRQGLDVPEPGSALVWVRVWQDV